MSTNLVDSKQFIHLLVNDVVNLERSHHVSNKLWVNIGVPDAVMQKLPCCALMGFQIYEGRYSGNEEYQDVMG